MSTNPDTVTQPVIVNPNPLPEQFAAAIRTAGVLLGGVSAIVGFLSAHDLRGLVAFLRSDQFLPIAGAAVAAGSFLYGQWKTRHRKAQLVTIATAVDDAVAVVKGQEMPGPADAAATAANAKAGDPL